jgi:hypothetical protein
VADDEIEMTEMHDIKVTRQDGVRTPASGYGFLVMKAVGANGQQNEKPDIAGANKVLALLAQLVASEAEELAAGYEGESCDIALLLSCISEMKYFRDRETMTAEMAKDVDTVNDLVSKLTTPESDSTVTDAQADAPESVDTQTPPATEPEAGGEVLSKAALDAVEKMIEDRVAAEVSKVAEERDKALAAYEVLKSTPIPGGPAMTATAVVREDKARDEAMAKAVAYEREAKRTTDPEAVQYYKAQAAKARAAAE